MVRQRLRSTLFPYTTLFRSELTQAAKRKILGLNSARIYGLAGAAEASEHGKYRPVPADYASRMSRQLDRKSTRLNSSHVEISYAVFCLKKKKKNKSNYSLTK